MDHIVESVVTEMLVDEQPLTVLAAASYEFFDVGMLKLGDALNHLQEFFDRHFCVLVVKLQYCKLEGTER